jgi:hypothetical protein
VSMGPVNCIGRLLGYVQRDGWLTTLKERWLRIAGRVIKCMYRQRVAKFRGIGG